MSSPRRALLCQVYEHLPHVVVSDAPAVQPRRAYVEGREDYDAAPEGTVLDDGIVGTMEKTNHGWKMSSGWWVRLSLARRNVKRWGPDA